MNYDDEARALWKAYVPKRGQANSVQGELMRAVEKLRDEAQRNGNQNWRNDHFILVDYLRETLINSGMFDDAAIRQVQSDTARLLDFEHPETADRPYDRLTERIVEWSRAHADPVPREHNPRLHI